MAIAIGSIKGYKVNHIDKNNLKKDDMFSELEKKDSKIKELIIDIVENKKGIVYGFIKEKKIKAVYIFSEQIKNENEKKIKFLKGIKLDEITEEISNKFEKVIEEDLKELVSFGSYKSVEWSDKEIVPEIVKIGKFNITAGAIGAIVGILMGVILFDDILIGVCFSLVFASSGAIVKKKK